MTKYCIKTNVIVIANNEKLKHSSFSENYSINYEWCDLEENSKTKLMTTRFKFNNHDTALCCLIKPISRGLKEENLKNILKLVEKNIHDAKLPPSSSFYIKREFKSMSKGRSQILYTENMADIVSQGKPVILADVVKSTSAIEIAAILKKKTSNWIAFIDLKSHLEKFKKTTK